jgi:hypothetical protein
MARYEELINALERAIDSDDTIPPIYACGLSDGDTRDSVLVTLRRGRRTVSRAIPLGGTAAMEQQIAALIAESRGVAA